MIFQRLYTLRKWGWSVDDYTEEFHQLVTRNNLSETKEQQVARYITELCQSIQDVLSLYSLWTVSEAYQRVLTVGKQQSRSRASRFQDRGARPKEAPSVGRKDVVVAPINHQNTSGPGTRVQGSSSTLRCFKCGEPNKRPDKSKELMIVDENLDDVDGYDSDPIYDGKPYEDDLVYGDVGKSLVIQKNHTNPISQN
ncbi:hypothetical protein AMTRI_Chr06g198480 [Amborella trichopoda]